MNSEKPEDAAIDFINEKEQALLACI